MRRVVPADLLPTAVADPAARRRFELLADVCKGISFNWDIDASAATQRQNIKDFDVNGGCVAMANLMLRKGPIQAAPGGSTLRAWQYLNRFAKALAFQARLAGAAGDHGLCCQCLKDEFSLLKAVCGAGGGAYAYIEFASIDSIATHCAADCVREGDLTALQERYLLVEVEGIGASKLQEMEDLKQELNTSLFAPTYGVASMAGEFSTPMGGSDQGEQNGNFDTISTAKLMIRLFSLCIDNSGKSWSSRYAGAEQFQASLAEELPKNPWNTTSNTDANGRRVPSSSEKVAYEAAMNAIPNSAGIRFISEEPDWGQRVGEASARIACNHALLTASIGIAEYRADHQAQFPPSLEELVKGQYLEAVPLDGYSGRSIHYSPHSGILYCVGANGRDENGKFAKELDPTEPDYGLFATAKPLVALQSAVSQHHR